MVVKNKYSSILKDIDNKFTNKNFTHILSILTIEELLIAKLELSAKHLNGKLFGYPLYKNVQHIVRESLVKFSLRFCNSQEKAANMLGLNVREFKAYIKKHNLNLYKESDNG